MTAPLLWGFFGVDMNVWIDAFLRLQLVVIVMTVTVMALIYIERKFVGRIQMRLGPMCTGPFGTLQSIADAVKLLTKEDLRPTTADRWLFELAPFVTFVPVFMAVLAVSMVAGSLNINDITRDQDVVPYVLLQPLPFLIFITATLAELSRRPFDIPIGESELVGGPWVEYSGIRWSIIFALTEYASLWGMSILAALIFLGGWQWPFGTASFWGDFAFVYQLLLVFAKSMFLILTMMWISATFPRLRIDQLMSFCWKILLPFGFLQIVINGIVLVYVSDETARNVVLFLTSGALLIVMSYVIYLATRQPSRETRLAAIVAARSGAQ